MAVVGRDYRVSGPERERALAAGLADATWYRPAIDPGALARLSERTDARAAADTLLWLGLLVASGFVAWLALGSWWAIPAFAVYGALYGGAADSRWHEFGHGTGFRTTWLNDLVYYPASFMLWREPTVWRWSHFRHHTDTIIVGRDAEIGFPRPRSRRDIVSTFCHLVGGPRLLARMVRHAFGRIDDDTRDLVPAGELARVRLEAQVFVAILAGVVVWAAVIGSPVPLLFVGLPTIYGAWLFVFFGMMQHAGLREDVLDHRHNTRTVHMNPVFRFLYSNMNFHLEHHLFPTVPYRSLPELHSLVADQLPPPAPSCVAAYREIFDALAHQHADPTWEIDRPLPPARVGATVPQPVDRSATRGTVDAADHRGGATPVSSTSIDLGPVGDFAVGRLTRVDHDGCTYALACLGPGEFALTDGMCTHGAAHLADGALLGDVIECPRHNGRFDARTGAACRRPARVAIGTHRVAVVDGRVVAEPGGTAGSADPA